MEFNVAIMVAAAAVGVLVGLTGVGAGAFMTPLLIVGFGVSPGIAVATDLLYASVTKAVGGMTHLAHGGVQWTLLRRLWLGGVMGVGAGVFLLVLLLESRFESRLLPVLLSCVIAVSAGGMLIRSFRRESPESREVGRALQTHALVPMTGGALVGFAVSLTSVGAGALGMALLTRVSPTGTPSRALVGTDLLFSFPIALLAGMSYLFHGLVDLHLLTNLLIGSLPGVVLGSLLVGKVRARFLDFIIGLALLFASILILDSLYVS